jgi:hypothetical protein
MLRSMLRFQRPRRPVERSLARAAIHLSAPLIIRVGCLLSGVLEVVRQQHGVHG